MGGVHPFSTRSKFVFLHLIFSWNFTGGKISLSRLALNRLLDQIVYYVLERHE